MAIPGPSRPPTNWFTSDTAETLTFYDVDTPIREVAVDHSPPFAGVVSTYQDLGSGAVVGSANVTASTEAVAGISGSPIALANAAGRDGFVVGAAVTSLRADQVNEFFSVQPGTGFIRFGGITPIDP